MKFAKVLAISGFIALSFSLFSCGESAETEDDGGSNADITLSFQGPVDAYPLTATTALVSWLIATNTAGDSADSMTYTLYRGDTEDFDTSLTPSHDIWTISGTVTGNPSKAVAVNAAQHHFFKVKAADSHDNTVLSNRVVSTFPPEEPVTGSILYENNVEFLWAVTDNLGNTCMTCHDGSRGSGTLDLSSYIGVMNGLGDAITPDSFTVPGDGGATWALFALGFTSNFIEHFSFADHAPLFQITLSDWAEEGCLEYPEEVAPIFQFGQVGNGSHYYAEPDWNAETVTLHFFHAEDSESTPYGSPTFDHLEYVVYGGEDSNSIDWVTPLATVARNTSFPTMDNEFSVTLPWTLPKGSFVIRAKDYVGNETINEKELTVQQ
ncbi:MAG: hypothetical protein OTJ44_05525 [Planctomycetota bacterium]|nr:hypothetical protein [Planctomycetota bacterium]